MAAPRIDAPPTVGAQIEARAAHAHSFAFAPLAFPAAPSASGRLCDGDRLLEIDEPSVVVSAIEPTADGGAEVRVVNLAPRPCQARVRWNAPGSASVQPIDLTGRPAADPDLARDASDPLAGQLRLRPWQIATLRCG